MKVVAFVPAKGTSSRVPNKNVSLLAGKPLVRWTIEKLVSCDFIDEVYLDTESDEVYSIVEDTGCHFLKRDPSLATNATDGHALFFNEARQVPDADIFVQALGTSPFVLPSTIKKGVDAIASHKVDSAILVTYDKLLCWDGETGEALYDTNHLPNSFELPDTIYETTGLYITNRDIALNLKKRHGDHPLLIPSTRIEQVDINTPEDFAFAEIVMSGIGDKKTWGW